MDNPIVLVIIVICNSSLYRCFGPSVTCLKSQLSESRPDRWSCCLFILEKVLFLSNNPCQSMQSFYKVVNIVKIQTLFEISSDCIIHSHPNNPYSQMTTLFNNAFICVHPLSSVPTHRGERYLWLKPFNLYFPIFYLLSKLLSNCFLRLHNLKQMKILLHESLMLVGQVSVTVTHTHTTVGSSHMKGLRSFFSSFFINKSSFCHASYFNPERESPQAEQSLTVCWLFHRFIDMSCTFPACVSLPGTWYRSHPFVAVLYVLCA